MAREVLSNGVINPDKYQADWYADLSNNWNLLDNLIGSAISGSEVDSKISTAIQELMVRTFQIVAELPATGTEGVMYLVLIPNTSKYTAYVWENNAYRELGVIQMTITIDDELSTTSENPVQNKVITNALGGKASSSHTHSASDITSGLANVATSGSYNDLSNTPTIPTVNNATLTIQQNGTNVQTFTANQSTNATANITVPTKTSDLTNDSGFITEDTTKIPLAGSNAISGSLIPATTNTYNLGSPSLQWNNTYTRNILIDNDINIASSVINKTSNSGTLALRGGTNPTDGASIGLYGKDYTGALSGCVYITAYGNSDNTNFRIFPNGTISVYNNSTATTKNVAMQEDTVPRSGGAVITGNNLGRVNSTELLYLNGGPGESDGGHIVLFGASYAWWTDGRGAVRLNPTLSSTTYKSMYLYPEGTWTWDGTACQITSDQRYKQQITEIDDKLLDAWEDVDLVQFKYNDAVDQKKDKARLHTGYVVQQIDSACKSHNVDISEYGLYCHEEYPQETEEVEVEQADGTKVKETKVIREASEHYSLRYTEALIVECAYLRKKLKELTARIEQLEKGNNSK